MKNAGIFVLLSMFLFGCAGTPVVISPAEVNKTAVEEKKTVPEEIKAVIEEKKEVTAENKAMIPEVSAVTSEVKTAAQESMMAKTEVKAGDNIEVEYEGSLKDGTVFDSSKGRAPLGFEVGAGQMIKGFDNGVLGMKLNEEKTIDIKAEDAYGNRDEKMMQSVEKSFFPADYVLEKGAKVGLQHKSGQQMQAIIADITTDKVLLDFNHFLAGKELIFKVKIISIK